MKIFQKNLMVLCTECREKTFVVVLIILVKMEIQLDVSPRAMLGVAVLQDGAGALRHTANAILVLISILQVNC